MAKVKISENKAEEVKTDAEGSSAPVEAVVEKVAAVKFPEVARTGKFQAVKVGEGYAVYNPDACRVSGVILLSEAQDIVLKQNRAAQL